MISECNRLAQKEYESRHDEMGKVIHWECKKSKFGHTNKWYKHWPESILEYEKHRIIWDFVIETDHLNSARRPDLVIVNKRKSTYWMVDIPADDRVKIKESEKRDKYLDLDREKNLWTWRWKWYKLGLVHLGQSPKDFLKELLDLDMTTNRDHPDYSIIKIGQNSKKSPEHLGKLIVTQTSGRNHPLKLVWKTLKGVNNNKSTRKVWERVMMS